ncbi:MBL fold metallo-hydrolase [Clostridium sp. DL1XJH146]
MEFSIKWIGQGGFIVKFKHTQICVDPYLSNSVFLLEGYDRIIPIPICPEKLEVDFIMCTHDHIDHFDEDTLKNIHKKNIKYIGPNSCIKHFEKIDIPKDKIIPLNRMDNISINGIKIYGVYADHTEDSIGIVFVYENISIYIVGDSLYNEQLTKVKQYNPDILICPINGKLGNMNYKEAAKLAIDLGVKVAVPCHYGMFSENTEDPENFRKELLGSPVKYEAFSYNKKYSVNEILKS